MSYSASMSELRELRELRRERRRERRQQRQGLVFRAQTYRNILYLFASFPLGIFYFVFLIAGLSAGLGSAIAIVGIPILFVTLLGWWGLAAFERQLVIWWLRIDIRPMYRPRPAGLSAGKWLKAHLGSSTTWTSLVYLLAKFPLSIISFAIAAGLTVLTSRLILAPLPYLLDAALGNPLDHARLIGPLALSAVGLAVGLVSLHIMNGLAVVSGRFARLMLGQSDLAARLSATQAVAERATVKAQQSEQKAEQSEQKRRELIVNVSHELRTPIASIRGHVDSLMISIDRPDAADTSAPPPAELRKYLGIISRETERLGTLVDELLSLARAESGELKIALAPVAPDEVVEEVYSSIAPLAKRERQIIVVRDVSPNLPSVVADRQRLTQVLLNLVRNAIAYTPTGGIVSIGLHPDGPDAVALTVADTGIGIPQEDLDQIFDRFYRTDASRARTSGGFGLGLAIVRDLVAAMGGTVKVESTVGEGSTFTVTLRVAAQRPAGAEQGAPRPPVRPPAQAQRQEQPKSDVVPW
jgi:two-component system phosphate regulon sensor histidine kinase PhoR